MTQHYSDPGNVFASREEAPTCECGRVTGHRCDWQGEVGELVTIEWMPIGLRASHAAAGNSGRWPHNGADRLRVSRECADSLVAGNDGWASFLRLLHRPQDFSESAKHSGPIGRI